VTRRTLSESAKARSELPLFLNFLRRRIDPDVRSLGPRARLPKRLGKRVTQEELAEVIGVTREWYALLESGARTRASTDLIDRLAVALMVTAEERARLFRLALPELAQVRLRDETTAVLEAFSSLKSLTQRLWSATSVEDVLTHAAERIADWFDDALLVHTPCRRESGLWTSQVLDDKQDRHDVAKVVKELRDHVLPTAESIDAGFLYPQLSNPGDVGGGDLHPPAVRQQIAAFYARHRLKEVTFLLARVRSRTGVIGGFCITHEFGRSYSAADHAVLGAFAELTSFALS
jgi:transcriptional regulator with XRE-family HTH domain